DLTTRRLDSRGGAVAPEDRRHRRLLEDAHAAALGTLGERLRRVDRVGLPVLGKKDRADDVARLDQRVERRRLLRRQHLDLEAEAARHRGAAAQLLEALLRTGDAERTHLLEAGGLAGLLAEGAIEVGGVLCEARQVVRGAQLADQAGGVPGGAAGELAALQQHDVAAVPPRQMIGEAATDDAAADDDDPSLSRKRAHDASPRAARPTLPP